MFCCVDDHDSWYDSFFFVGNEEKDAKTNRKNSLDPAPDPAPQIKSM